MTEAFRVRLRIRDKATHRIWTLDPPSAGRPNGIWGYIEYGRKVLITTKAGYGEYNDRGEPVLDSWTVPERYGFTR